MRFKGLDLNLLGLLQSLLETRSVTRTASDMHLTQPAISAALNRLRDYFQDPLFVIQGRRMIPTALALQLLPHVELLLTHAETVTSTTALFDPATSTRHFRICASDYLTIVIFRPLMLHLSRVAPGITCEIIAPSENATEVFNNGELDLLLSPREYLSPAHPVEALLEEQYVVAGWSGNPMFAEALSVDDFQSAGHVAVRLGSINRSSFAESQLRAMGMQRRVEVLVPSFGLVPELLLETNRIAIMHARLAAHSARTMPIKYCPLPFPFPTLSEGVQFHRTRMNDAGLSWMIARIVEYAGSGNDEQPA